VGISLGTVFVCDLAHSLLMQHAVALDHPTSTLSASYTVLHYYVDLLILVATLCHCAPAVMPWVAALGGLFA